MPRSCMRYPDELRERMLYLKSVGKSHQEIGDAVGLNRNQVNCFLRNHYKAMHEKNPEQYPLRKRGRQPRVEPTRKELEDTIKEQKKLIKLYQDFLRLAGRM